MGGFQFPISPIHKKKFYIYTYKKLSKSHIVMLIVSLSMQAMRVGDRKDQTTFLMPENGMSSASIL